MDGLNIGFIGAGNMAGAIMRILLEHDVINPNNVYVYDSDVNKLAVCSSLGFNAVSSNLEVVKNSELVFLAVKPQSVENALDGIKHYTSQRCFVSIMAGVSVDYLRTYLETDASVIRVMPNMALSYGCGATVIAKSEDAPYELFKAVVTIFELAGIVVFLEENKLNEIIPFSASSPAFFFMMADIASQAAEDYGLDPSIALKLFGKAMEGAAVMLAKSGDTAAELMNKVASPGGTTLAALEVFKERGLSSAMHNAIAACVERAYEIGK